MEKYRINTPVGNLRVYEKSIKLDIVAKPLFLNQVPTKDIIDVLVDIICESYSLGRESKIAEIKGILEIK